MPYRRSSFPASCAPILLYAVCVSLCCAVIFFDGLHSLLLQGLWLRMHLDWLVPHIPTLGLRWRCGTSPLVWRMWGTRKWMDFRMMKAPTSSFLRVLMDLGVIIPMIFAMASFLGDEYFVHPILGQFWWHPCFFAHGDVECLMSKLWSFVNICYLGLSLNLMKATSTKYETIYSSNG